MTPIGDLAEQLAAESARLEAELREIDLLVTQARNEAGRHEARRATAAEKLAALGTSASARDAVEVANQAVTLTRRAALMDAQVEILEAKRKALVRLRDAVDDHVARVRALGDGSGEAGEAVGAAAGTAGAAGAPEDPERGGGGSGGAKRDRIPRTPAEGPPETTPAVSRIILAAQEDLRREIARAMHDGPAQSLTNIVLQAEIVERLVGRDPAVARAEVGQLVAMVQQTLEATKTFIFDVRPMVLDDLGLVPTLRRAARDRGRRAGIAVEFESVGVDRRLPMELESGLFRILDEALAGYLAARPEQVSLRLDWADELDAQLSARRTAAPIDATEPPTVDGSLPPALAAMVEERRAEQAAAVEAARRAAVIQLPANVRRDLVLRAGSLGITAELLDDGGRLRLIVGLPGSADEPADSTGAGADTTT